MNPLNWVKGLPTESKNLATFFRDTNNAIRIRIIWKTIHVLPSLDDLELQIVC